MISLEGIVTKCSLVRPKVVKSVHYCEKEDRFLFREYRDQTMTASGAASTGVYPTEDEDKHPVCVIVSLLISKLISSSLLPSTATAHTETIKQSPFKKCPNVHPLDNYHEV
jgi:hypothetical protein